MSVDFGNVLSNMRWLPAVNDGDEEIPAFGLCRIIEADDEVVHVESPASGTDPGELAVNGPFDLAVDERGSVCQEWPNWALYDESEGSGSGSESGSGPASGEEWGVGSDHKLHPGRTGFLIVGGAFGGRALVTRRLTSSADTSFWAKLTGMDFTGGSGSVSGSGCGGSGDLDSFYFAELTIVDMVSVTGGPGEDGLYDALVQRYDFATMDWQTIEPCKVIDANAGAGSGSGSGSESSGSGGSESGFGTPVYSWIEQEETSPGVFQDKEGGRSGTCNAYAVNRSGTMPLGMIVRLRPRDGSTGGSGSGSGSG